MKTKGVTYGIFLVLMALVAQAADQPVPEVKSGVPKRPISSAVINFSDLAAQEKSHATVRHRVHVHPSIRDIRGTNARMPFSTPNKTAPVFPQPLLPSASTTSNFLGLLDDQTIVPPDTMGAVGPNHVMTTLNSQVRIQTKTGTTLSTVSLDAFWAPVGGAPSCFDPKLTYDPFNNRWIFAAAADGESASSAVLIAVSQNSDPTGTWFLYKADADASDVYWADFPALGFNKDWIVVSMNMFPNSGPGFGGVNFYVFSKTNLYAHGLGQLTLLQDTSGLGFTITPAQTYDNSLSPEYLLDVWDSLSGQLRVSTITGPVGAETLTLGIAFPTSGSWDEGGIGDFLPQLGSTRKIDGGDTRLGSCVFRNGTLWATHTIFLPAGASSRTAAQWWQVTTNGAVQQVGRIDDPTGVLFYAYPSIAVNSNNDMLIGYSRFSANQYASGNYSLRLGIDSINTLRADTVMKAGEGTYIKTFGGPDNRWGDYSSTVLDPSSDSTFWTLQEYAAAPAGDPNIDENNSRWGTWWGRVDAGISIVIASNTITAEDCAPGNGVIDPNETITLNFTFRNVGATTSTNLIATLQTNGGVTLPSAAQNLGALATGASATRAFTFNANGTCGGTITATFQLQDGALNLGTIKATFTLGVLNVSLAQTFDSVSPPTLPAGWTALNAIGAASTWVTTSTINDSAPNSAFVADASVRSDNRLTSPTFLITTTNAVLTFRNYYNLEFGSGSTAYDGGVLEISIGGGLFTDILAAGGSFVTGGYNRTVSSSFQNPLAGRQAWSGDSGGFITTTVNLPISAAGQNVQLRWRCGTDTSDNAVGWYVDTISVKDGYACCASLVVPAIVNPRISTTNFLFSFQSTAGQSYTILYKDSLNVVDWQTLQILTGDGTLRTITNPLTSTSSNRFFRVRSP
jgi:hypothetical protein